MSVGTVYLVGAGPGDPGLMTVRAVELIARADVILFDKLIPVEALDGARADCEFIDVGKIGGGAQVPQDVTTKLLVEKALAGHAVVRLKGGDPFVFGRGGEEAQACVAAGVPFEVVPAVTSGIAAPAYAGIPVTQRGMAPAVAFVTGHEDPAKSSTQVDWPALAAFPGTLCFYMGVRQLGRISERLIAGGRPADEPVAVVMRGTFGDQRSVRGTLATIVDVVAAANITAPAITVVGAVATLHDELSWLRAARPLGGTTVAVTRARAQASGVASKLRALGASVVEAPAIRIEPIAADLSDIADFDLVVFTSINAVARVFEELRDARALAGATVAAIGPGTTAKLREHGIEADVVPARSISEAVLEELGVRGVGGAGSRVLIPRAEEARDVLPDGLRALGAEVDVRALYRTVAEPLSEQTRAAALGAEIVCFTSASSVQNFHDAAGTLAGPRLVTIGPITSDAVRAFGFAVDVEATEQTPDGLVAAVVASASQH